MQKPAITFAIDDLLNASLGHPLATHAPITAIRAAKMNDRQRIMAAWVLPLPSALPGGIIRHTLIQPVLWLHSGATYGPRASSLYGAADRVHGHEAREARHPRHD
jgi:hypothetical protein